MDTGKEELPMTVAESKPSISTKSLVAGKEEHHTPVPDVKPSGSTESPVAGKEEIHTPVPDVKPSGSTKSLVAGMEELPMTVAELKPSGSTESLATGKVELPLPVPDVKPSGSTESQSLSPASDCSSNDSRPSPASQKATDHGQLSTSPRSTQATTPDDSTPPLAQLKKQPAVFDLGQACSSSEQSLGGEYVDESAIDDDSDSDWEDSIDDDGKAVVDSTFFQRVPSNVHIASRPSLLTLMLAQSELARKLAEDGSQSTAAVPGPRAGPGAAPAPGASSNSSEETPLTMTATRHSTPTAELDGALPQCSPRAIPASSGAACAPAVLSPRSTRQNMVAAELPASLRRGILWERHQKTSTADAVLKRRHTSHDMANLWQVPETPCMREDKDDAAAWHKHFAENGYHAKGW